MNSPSIRPFTFLLIGQAISLFGSSLTGFALGVWAYHEVGSVTIYALIALANILPMVLLSPLAGAVVDRMSRKKIIILAQIAAIIITATLALLYWADALKPWHIIALVALNSCFNAFVLPSVSATIPLMVGKADLTRANGMIALAFGLIELITPALAGTIYTQIGMEMVFIIDLATFAVGIFVLILIPIPRPRFKSEADAEKAQQQSLWQSIAEGWSYLRSEPSLLAMIMFYSTVAATLVAIGIMVQPMILGFTDAQHMGVIMSCAATGVLLGSSLMILLKNIQTHMPIILTVTLIVAVGCIFTPMFTTPWIIAVGGFVMMCCFPIFDANNRALFQRKVEATKLGRVIGLRNFALGIAQSIMLIIAGPVADGVFEPAMQQGGFLVPYFADIYGVGPGRGIAVMISMMGCVMTVLVLVAIAVKRIRRIDTLIVDADTLMVEA